MVCCKTYSQLASVFLLGSKNDRSMTKTLCVHTINLSATGTGNHMEPNIQVFLLIEMRPFRGDSHPHHTHI